MTTIRRLASAAALTTALTGLVGCGGDDGAGVRELEGDCPTSGSASGSASGSGSGSEASGSASQECETTPSSEGSGSQ